MACPPSTCGPPSHSMGMNTAAYTRKLCRGGRTSRQMIGRAFAWRAGFPITGRDLMRGEMRRRRRWLWIILLAAPLVLLSVHTVYWHIAISHLEDGFRAWVAEQRGAGWSVNNRKPVRSGWPLAATLTMPGLSLQGGNPTIPGGL